MNNEHFESLYPADTWEKEIEHIFHFVKEGNSCQLVGIPGVGRSNLLGLLSFNRNVRIKHVGENQKWFHFVTVNFSEVRKKPLLDVTKFLFLTLVDSLRERNLTEEFDKANLIFKDSLSFNDELVLFQGLKRVIDLLAIEKELTIVFLFDRFEEYVPMLTPDFFTNLRVLRDRAKYRFSVVFSVSRPLEQTVETTMLSDFYTFMAGHLVFMPLCEKKSVDFRLSYLEKVTGKKLEDKTKEELLQLTGGHGKMIRICAEEILAVNNPVPKPDIFKFLVENKHVRSVSYEIWEMLHPDERTVLKNLALKKPVEENQAIFLREINLLKDDSFTIPLFEDFVKFRAEQIKNEKITINEVTNDIMRGEEVLSNNLTNAEIRLLKLLIQNPERIIEREEIINIVWSDLQSKEGVTDQALDQLIFRIRKKIETDPNNPQHLQTIKGRGFKFNP